MHLHQFDINDQYYSLPDPENNFIDDDIDERKMKLCNIITSPKAKFIYEYDFGNGWRHRLEVESIKPSEKGIHYPICLAGKRACPPEDCGGPWGYEDFLKAISDPSHEEHKTMLEWIGGEFDPEDFDLEITNEMLREYL